MRVILALAIGLHVAAFASAAEDATTGPRGIESLGRELLDDLAPDVLQQPSTRPHAPVAPAPRFADLGEDIGPASGPAALARVRHNMQRAETLLAERPEPAQSEAFDEANAAQQDVIEQLDELIAQLSKQCQGGQCQPGDKRPKPSERSQSKPGKPGSAGGRGQTAARDSTSRLNQSRAQRATDADARAIAKDLWGHLPERSREQMLQSFSDEFLPEYELEIEQYYRRLSEEQQTGQPE